MEENQAEKRIWGREERGEEGGERKGGSWRKGREGKGRGRRGGSFTVAASHSISLSNATNSTHPV